MDEDKELLQLGAEPHEDDELHAMGAITPEQHDSLANYIKSDQPSMAESAMGGAEQGASLGSADELGAVGATALSAARRGLGYPIGEGQSLSDLYTEYRDLNRNRYKQQEQANPNTFLAGELAGGLVLPAGSSGALKGASMLQKMKTGAVMGAGLGTVGAAGVSEAPIASPEFAQDVGTGGVIGAVSGGLLPPALGAAKGVAQEVAGGAKWAGEKLFGPVGTAFEMGQEGIKAATKPGQKIINKELGQFANNVAPSLTNPLKNLGTIKNQIIKDAEDSGIRINSGKIDEMIESRLGTDPESNLPQVQRELSRFQELLKTAKEGRITGREDGMPIRAGDHDLSKPTEMYRLYKDLQEQSKFGDYSFKTPEVLSATHGAMKESSGMLKDVVPGMESVDRQIQTYNNAASAIGIPDTRNLDESKVRDQILNLIGQEEKIGVGSVKAQEKIDDFITELSKVNKPMADRLNSEFSRLGSRMNTMKEINKPFNFLSPLGALRSVGTSAANVTGYYTGQATRALKDSGRAIVSKISEYTPDKLKQLALQFSQDASPAMQELSKVLVKAADSDERARNAVMFHLMQNPAYRKLLGNDQEHSEDEVK